MSWRGLRDGRSCTIPTLLPELLAGRTDGALHLFRAAPAIHGTVQLRLTPNH